MIRGTSSGRLLAVRSSIKSIQMIVCYDRYDWFQQIPFGAGVEHSFYLVYARVTFVVFLRCSDHALGLCALGSHHGLLAVIFIVVTQR